jgi:hypothetical protein
MKLTSLVKEHPCLKSPKREKEKGKISIYSKGRIVTKYYELDIHRRV